VLVLIAGRLRKTRASSPVVRSIAAAESHFNCPTIRRKTHRLDPASARKRLLSMWYFSCKYRQAGVPPAVVGRVSPSRRVSAVSSRCRLLHAADKVYVGERYVLSRKTTDCILFSHTIKAGLESGGLQCIAHTNAPEFYPETIPVLGTYWLKAVYARGYSLRQWKELNRLLKLAMAGEALNDTSRQVLGEIQKWIEESVVLPARLPESKPRRSEPVRADLTREQLMEYTIRLLNEWLPVEVARLLVGESESALKEDGIPVLATARALERLLIREHLSETTLQGLLDPQLLSPQYAYPSDMEVLRDVVLWLIGRTQAPAPFTFSPELLFVVPNSHFPADYREAIRNAVFARRPYGEEIHVPIAPASTFRILREERVQIGSVIITMDGCLWESESLQSGDEDYVIYRPVGLLRIDYSGDHAWFRAPWPELRLHWSGGSYSVDNLTLFGREWRFTKWEVDSDHMWAHFVFSHVLPTGETPSLTNNKPWRLRPASIDMAWAALDRALTAARAQKNGRPIEELRFADLIPVGRALFELVTSQELHTHIALETRLGAIRFMVSSVQSEYGLVPWRILPESVRQTLARLRYGPRFAQLVTETFEGLPEDLVSVIGQSTASRLTSPSAA